MSEEIRTPEKGNANEEAKLSEILQVRRDKLKALQDAGADPFQITKFDVSHHAEKIKAQYDALENTEVTVAGRMMSKRIMGKASFAHVQDLSGNMQLYVARDSLGEEAYAGFKKMDIGDIIGVKGLVFKTKTGEISLHATEITLLSKSLQPLP
ncbi:MAG: lysine--tRNA ligase, partial [Clostridia bacterium]|nr:lysine--tRNA ligase [Clostridia bacterium]